MENLAIIIPTHNRVKLLSRLLDQLLKQKKPDSISLMTIFVVDDGSCDDTQIILKENYPTVQIIVGSGNWWWTKSINAGLKKALSSGYDYFLILNDDNEVDEDYLKILFIDYRSLEPGSLLGSASVSLEQEKKIDSSGTYNFRKLDCKHIHFHPRGAMIDDSFKGVKHCVCFSGRGTLIPKTLIKNVGYLDERMVQYGSDEDFVLRCSERSIPVYISWNARVLNHTSMTSYGKFKTQLNFRLFLRSLFDPYTNNNLWLNFYFYWKHCYKALSGFYIVFNLFKQLIWFFVMKIRLYSGGL